MKFLSLFLPLLAALGMVACDKPSVPGAAGPATVASVPAPVSAPAKPEIGLVMKTLTNPFFIEMEKGARRAEKELDVKLKVRTAAQETSIEQQIQLVDDLILARVAAIVIAPGDSQRLVPVLKKAVDAGIRVVNIDNRLDPEAVSLAGLQPIPFVSVDNEAGAYKAGQFLAKGIAVPTQAAILEGIRSADNARQRAQGALRGLLENKFVKVVASETANWKIDESYEVTRQMFTRHPDIQLLFAANDVMAIGAIKYLQESGKTKVKVAGFDALSEAVAEVRAHRMAATVDQQAALQGYQGVVLAHQLLQGKPVPPVTLIDTRLVTSSNVQ